MVGSESESPPTTTQALEERKKPPAKPKKIIINVVNTKYESVKDVAKRKMKWKLSVR